MACGRHYVTCTTNGCSGHRSSCSTNRAISISDIHIGGIIQADDIERLRTNTLNEINRWNTHRYYNFSKRSTSAFVVNEVIGASKTNKLISDLSNVGHGSTPTVSVGSIVVASKISGNLLTIYNAFRSNCICNGDCNPVSVCSCNSNCSCYSYSDNRLKINIKEI